MLPAENVGNNRSAAATTFTAFCSVLLHNPAGSEAVAFAVVVGVAVDIKSLSCRSRGIINKCACAETDGRVPALISDNYFSIAPGEEKMVTVRLLESVRQEAAAAPPLIYIDVAGWNVATQRVSIPTQRR